MTPEEGIRRCGEIIGLENMLDDPEHVVAYVAKRQGSFEIAMEIIRRRKTELAEALGVGEEVPFPRMIEMIKERRS